MHDNAIQDKQIAEVRGNGSLTSLMVSLSRYCSLTEFMPEQAAVGGRDHAWKVLCQRKWTDWRIGETA